MNNFMKNKKYKNILFVNKNVKKGISNKYFY